MLSLALFLLPLSGSSNVQQLNYSQLKSDIGAGQVASVAIGPDGNISGTLKNGTKFTSSYPVNLQDPQFTQLLEQHKVQVTAVGAQSSFLTVLLSLLPLLLERETVDGTDVDEILGRVPGRRQPVGATGHTATATPADDSSTQPQR